MLTNLQGTNELETTGILLYNRVPALGRPGPGEQNWGGSWQAGGPSHQTISVYDGKKHLKKKYLERAHQICRLRKTIALH